MIANLPTWIVNIFCRGGFQHCESFNSEQGARNAARLAKQLEFVIDVEIVPPGQMGAYSRPFVFSFTRREPGCR
jgi:hypothetical protein